MISPLAQSGDVGVYLQIDPVIGMIVVISCAKRRCAQAFGSRTKATYEGVIGETQRRVRCLRGDG